MPQTTDKVLEHSRRLCKESRELRESARIAVSESREAFANSRRLRDRLEDRRRLKKT